MRKFFSFCCILLIFNGTLFSQEAPANLEALFAEMAVTKPGLDEITELDVSGLTLYEIITSIAEEHRLNVSVDPSLTQPVVSKFFDLKVKDVYIFLINKYNLEVDFMNDIITFKQRAAKKEIIVEKPKKKIDVTFNKANQFLSVKLRNDSLPLVAEAITELSNKNIVLSPEVKEMKVSAYIINRPFEQVVEMIAKSNQMTASIDENGFYFLSKKEQEEEGTANATRTTTSRGRRLASGNRAKSRGPGTLDIELNENGYLAISANDADATTLISEASELLGIDYFFYQKPEDVFVTMEVDNIDFDSLLDHALKGESYTSKKWEDSYLIGLRTSEGLRVSELIQLENRTIENVLSVLPKAWLEDVEIQEFIELNGLLVSGSRPVIDQLKQIVRSLDKVVPLVQIEVLIVQYQKSHDVQTGLQAILGDGSENVQTQGILFPTTDVTLNATSINNLIDSFNGLGIINLGKVSRDFYANLTALENNSIISLKSTPKIATLSGHRANISIGETNYYFEQTNRLINTGVNDNILQSGQWKPTEANLSVDILPYVSLDEHITLEVVVEKSAFLGRAGENAPPDKTTQKFESLIRVKNNEMILLGGLDELEKENSGTGTPFLSRIPVIKWFFSGRQKSKEKSKLHVFIKPTLVY